MNIKDYNVDVLISTSENNSILLNLIFYIKDFELNENTNEAEIIKNKLLNVNTNKEIYNLLKIQLDNISKVIY